MPQEILIVEDDHDLRELLAAVLRSAGFLVSCAVNGRDALRLLADGSVPSLILFDLMMPVMDGAELCRRLGEHPIWAQIPCVLMSASRPEECELPGEAACFLAKPFDVETMVEVVSKHCRGVKGL